MTSSEGHLARFESKLHFTLVPFGVLYSTEFIPMISRDVTTSTEIPVDRYHFGHASHDKLAERLSDVGLRSTCGQKTQRKAIRFVDKIVDVREGYGLIIIVLTPVETVNDDEEK